MRKSIKLYIKVDTEMYTFHLYENVCKNITFYIE